MSSDVAPINLHAYHLAYAILRVIFGWYIKTHPSGLEHVPPDGVATLFVANHTSSVDVFAAGYALGRPAHFLSKVEVTRIPIFGPFLLACGAIPARRDQRDTEALRRMMAILEAGGKIGLAPEGTRSPDGRVGAYDPGFVWLAARTGARIVPVAIHGARDLMPKGAQYPRPGHLWVRFGEPISVADLGLRPSREAMETSAEAVRAQTLSMLADLVTQTGVGGPFQGEAA